MIGSAIDVVGISKVYRLYDKPSDRLKEALIRKPLHRSFATLSDISFAVSAGESLGIVGDNGAGKSTLLKIVAGTLTPTAGELKTSGRVSALLELGAGFHYEFTGRQNIWMNAALMGLSHQEIEKKESAMIAFSELGDFIDQPIKTYSSGMVVRLAFSIATSVDPDILIIDEALSVGDHYFQKKCIDRMLTFKRQGRTILFCSHAMFTVNQLCDRAIWIDHGHIREVGSASEVTANYENHCRKKSGEGPKREEGVSMVADGVDGGMESTRAVGADKAAVPVMVKSIRLNGASDSVSMAHGEPLYVDVVYESDGRIPFFVAAGIRRNDDLVCHVTSMAKTWDEPLCSKGEGKVRLIYEGLPFLHGEFAVVVFMMDDSGLHCFHKKASASFSVRPHEKWNHEIGLMSLDHQWVME